MNGTRLLVATLLAATALASSCAVARAPTSRAPLVDEADVLVFIDPIEPDTSDLSVDLRDVAAVRESGETFPLRLALSRLGSGVVRRQRLLAAGSVPAGRFTGLSLRMTRAAVGGSDETGRVLVPEGPVTVSAPFVAGKRAGVVLRVRFRSRESIRSGYRLEPDLSAAVAEKLPATMVGLALSSASNQITVFDKLSGRVAAAVPTGKGPVGIAVDPRSRRAYLAVSGDDAVEVVDLQEYALVDRRTLQGGDVPADLALTSDGRTLVVANSGSGTVAILDAVSLTELRRVAVGNGPSAIVLDRTGRRAVVLNTLSNSITIVDVDGGTVAGSMAVDVAPVRADFNRRGDRLYVAQRSSSHMAVIDPLSLSIIRRVYVGTGAVAVKVDPRTDRIFLARSGTARVEVFDPSTLLPLESIPAGGDVAFLAIDSESNTLALLLPAERLLRTLRLVGNSVAIETDLGDGAAQVAFVESR